MADNLVWVDLEMTGLDAETCAILEIAVIVTDPQLNELPGHHHAVIHQDESTLAKMAPIAREMHSKSGLTERVRASKVPLAQAETEALAFISKYCAPGEAPLCGNSVHVDRRFLMAYMPKFIDYLHYRIIDVSSLKELVRRWYPDLPKFPKAETHTALADIRESIGELRYYRRHVFRQNE
jgi:oligoribonuclease